MSISLWQPSHLYGFQQNPCHKRDMDKGLKKPKISFIAIVFSFSHVLNFFIKYLCAREFAGNTIHLLKRLNIYSSYLFILWTNTIYNVLYYFPIRVISCSISPPVLNSQSISLLICFCLVSFSSSAFESISIGGV